MGKLAVIWPRHSKGTKQLEKQAVIRPRHSRELNSSGNRL